jgi:ATP-dependent DNA helicase PIF1
VASSGIAAILLEGGTTAHSRFRIPIKIHEDSVCNIPMQSTEAQILRDTSIFIWDEAPMAHKHCFEAVDRLFRDLTNKDVKFGGKIFCLGGDFRQTLPVVLRGLRPDIIDATIKSSYLWHNVKQFRLTLNMRLNNDAQDYRDFLIRIGNGTEPSEIINAVPDFITIPDHIYMPLNIQQLFNRVYDNFEENFDKPEYLTQRAILSPLNSETDIINHYASERISTYEKEYLSNDSIVDLNDNNHYIPIEYLNNLSFSGIPPHKLKLKINMPVILLRNISNHKGLCNGTRMLIKSKNKRYIIYT